MVVIPEWEEEEKRPVRDHCGVVAVTGTQPVASHIYYALRAIQHRGQEAAGISTFTGAAVVTHKDAGLVENVFSPKKLAKLDGPVGIGHVRYATTGGSHVENAQPVVINSVVGDIAVAHNGDIVNSGKLRDELKAEGRGFLTTNDTEVAAQLLAREFSREKNRIRAIRNVMKRLIGSYCFVILVGDTVYAVRDALGIKPLCYGALSEGGGYVVASESTALNVLDAPLVRDVAPGEILEVTASDVTSHAMEGSDGAKAHCMFEYVYFARADSTIDASSVYDVRTRIGHLLAKQAPADADVVIPVPDSGRTHALGYAAASGIPFAEGLMKNRYVHRTFIMPDQEGREKGVRMKLNPVESVIRGKRVVLVDDSIVRGTTMRRIVKMLRSAGAKEVHVRVGSPPIVAPCYLGIDMNNRKQLIAADHPEADIQKILGADSLRYLEIDNLVDAIRKEKNDLCMGCLTGVYPVEIPGEKNRVQARLF